MILAARKSATEMEKLVKLLTDIRISASWVALDLLSEQSAKDAAAAVKKQFGHLDVLINCAASMKAGESVEKQSIEEVAQVFQTNVVGTWNVTQKFIPLLKKSEHGRIVNVSSGAGSFNDPQYGFLNGRQGIPCSGYGISKLAVNGLTVKTARELEKNHILVNAVCPDITNTFGFGPWGRPVEVSAKSVIWAATLPDDGPTGGFFRDGKPLAW